MTPVSEITGRLSKALSDRYRVERELGVGGMATVFLAHDLKHERDVALKVLHPELAAVLGAERFLAEIKVTAKLQHPHIMPLLDSGEADGLLFYVMPVVDGESLRARLQRDTQLSVDDAVRIAKEVGSALDYAHRHGVIHRDIKPENILLHDGRAQVTDFGIALAVNKAGGARLTQTGLSLGTPQYMAPEQAMGEKAVDARADVYALGCVLYEMLAGQAPFTGPTAQAIVAQVLTTDALPVTTHRKTVPQNVARAVHIALQKLPADRFASIAEFTGALEGSVVMPASPEEIAARGVSNTRVWGFVAAGVAIGAVIGALAFKGRASTASNAEPRFFQLALPDSAPFVVGTNRYDASTRSIAISRDGRSVVYVAGTPGANRLAVVRLDRGTVSVLRGTEGAYVPAFSPDGRSVAFAAGTSIKRIAIDDGAVATLATVDYPFSIVWGSDARIYLAGIETADAGCVSVLAEGGGAPSAATPEQCLVRALSRADPDGRILLGSNQPSMHMQFDSRSGDVKYVVNADSSTLRGSGLLGLWPDRLLFLRDSTILAAPFDFSTGRLTGQGVSLLSNVRREAWTGVAHMDLSHDGTLVWASGGDAAIGNFVWLDATGKPAGLALPVSTVVASYALSPDENRIAFTTFTPSGAPRILVADLRRRIVDEIPSSITILPGKWIRNGNAFTGVMERPGRRKPVLVDLSSGTPRIDSLNAFGDESGDGSMRCVDGYRSNNDRLMLVRRQDTVAVDGLGGWCRFSPTGDRLAYAKVEGIFVANTVGDVAASRVQVAPAGGDEPRWSEDGRTIYYRNANQFFAVSAPAAADMRVTGEPRVVFSGSYLQAWASWERSRSGRFLMLQGPPAIRNKTLNVMTNFPAFVEEKLKSAK